MKFYEKNWFLVLTLILFAPVGIFVMWRYHKINKPTKVIISIVAGLFFLIAASPNKSNGTSSTASNNTNTQQVSTSSQPTLSEEDKAKQQADAEAKKKAEEQAIAEQKAKEEAEAKAKAESAAKEWADFVAKNTKKLSAGDYTVGNHLDKGLYDVTFNGSGNLAIYSSDGSLMTNEIGGSDITKYRSSVLDGFKISISGMSINVKPAQHSLMSYSTINLYSGYWYVGQDVTKGRYKVTPVKGSGNFVIYDKSGYLKTNEILGSDIGVTECMVDLDNGDIIDIAGMDSVKFEPSN